MEIHCYANVPIEPDEPISAIHRFVRTLRDGAIGTDDSEIHLNLLGISARGKSTIQKFKPQRTQGAPWPKALEIAEELTSLGKAETKSLHFLLSAQGFRWKGSNAETSARVLLVDGKSFQRTKRFGLSAHLLFQAETAEEPFIQEMLAEIAKATGIQFQLQASSMTFEPSEPGRVTPEELFVTMLTWTELFEEIGEKVRGEVSIVNIPHLMTSDQSIDFRFDPAKLGKSIRVNFAPIVRAWLKKEFPEYARVKHVGDGEVLQKQIADGVLAILGIDKRPRAFSKEFEIVLGVGLTSPRFAPAEDRPFQLTEGLFRLFEIGPLPLKWTYYTEADLREALDGAATLLKKVLPIFERDAARMQDAHKRKPDEFAGPREVTAKQAYDITVPIAREWGSDAKLTRLNSRSAVMPTYLPLKLPVLNEKGCLAINGAWSLRFYSRSKEESLFIVVPSRGRITQMRMHSPHGRQWPSDTDEILKEGWIDSSEALRQARAVAREKQIRDAVGGVPAFELSSRANVRATGSSLPPLHDGMFIMEAAWRLTFSDSDDTGRTTTIVTIPAYGNGSPGLDSHTFDKHGRSAGS